MIRIVGFVLIYGGSAAISIYAAMFIIELARVALRV